jgi:hypothetical protein
MIKMMILAPRRPGMSHAEFRHYVTQIHGPLVKSVPEVAADIRAYHYNFPLTVTADEGFGHRIGSEYDIVTQAWFDSVEAQKANMRHPRYLSIIRPDEGRFADEANARFHYTREVELVAGPKEGTKLFYARRRKPGLTREAFQAAWQERFPPLLAANAGASGIIRRYVQNHVTAEEDHPDGADGKFFDLIDEFVLESPADWAALGRESGLRAQVAALEAELTDIGRTRAFFAETVRNI